MQPVVKKLRLESPKMMNAKTHVSILQEMMVKKGGVPNYNLIHDGGGTHINTFTYQVSCDGFVATGTGRCKKDAKHDAAKNMLETIAAARSYPQLPATPADSPVRTPLPETLPASPKASPNEPFLNAIGELKDLCAANELESPEYAMISDVGPPHARIFTYHCKVATFVEEGRATTKKQAKHEASRKMLERLMDVISDLKEKDINYVSCRSEEDSIKFNESRAKAQSLYPDLSKMQSKKINLGVKLADYHLKLKETFTAESIPTRTEVLDKLETLLEAVREDTPVNSSIDQLDNLKSRVSEFLDLINMDMSSAVYDCENGIEKMLVVKVHAIPAIVECEIGTDVKKLELKIIAKVLETFEMFLQ